MAGEHRRVLFRLPEDDLPELVEFTMDHDSSHFESKQYFYQRPDIILASLNQPERDYLIHRIADFSNKA